jgi:hypothetical protein
MTVAFSQAIKDAIITRYTPHCIGWACATASFWGMANDHDLDEPVRLTEEAPVRLRYGDGITIDRKLTLKTLRSGHHAAMRFYFKNGKFLEIEIGGVHSIDATAATVELNPC